MRLLLIALLVLTNSPAAAWTAPDFQALSLQQQERDRAREAQQRRRLADARQRLSATEKKVSQNDTRFRSLQLELEAASKLLEERTSLLATRRGAVTDLYTTARQTAGDLIAILRNSPTSPPSAELEPSLKALAASSRPLNLDALNGLWEDLHLTLTDTAAFSRQRLPVQVAPGVLETRDVTRIGTVLAVAGDRAVIYDRIASLYLAKPPGDRAGRSLYAAVTDADAGVVYAPFEPGRASASRTDPLIESVFESGPIGFVIVLLGGIGSIVVLVRLLIVQRLLRADRRVSPGSAAARLREQLDSHRDECSESLTGWLNTALRREARRAQWGHTVLSLIIGVAPLLGLLGTVTGMILTFHALRLYGSGDPVLMADGIAQALSTTMLGLTVAIPLLIGQRWLLAQSDRHLRHLDALALSLAAELNGVNDTRTAGRQAPGALP